jgi:glycosyltransferase involved in cell wall biosynthesis
MGYDRLGLIAAWLAVLGRDVMLVYHNFDVTSNGPGITSRAVAMLERLSAHRADVVAASSPGRAETLMRRFGLDRKPLAVGNCEPKRPEWRPTGELRSILESAGLRFDRLVVRLGTMGPGHAIEALLASLPRWRGNWGLILAGHAADAYALELRGRIAATGIEDRVLVLADVSNDLWYDCLHEADLGIALYEPGNTNHDSMAGAGTKLNLYLSAGIPAIVPDFLDFRAFLGRYPAGLAVSPTNAEAIGGAVNSILGGQQVYRRYARAAREAFEAEYNFEVQFAPLLQQIMAREPGPSIELPDRRASQSL